MMVMLGWQTEIGIWMMVLLMVMLRTWVILMGIGRAERMAY
jgi:hypothetical protein